MISLLAKCGHLAYTCYSFMCWPKTVGYHDFPQSCFSITVPSVCDGEIIEESIRFLEDWRDGFPPLDMSRVWSWWDAASLTCVYFLSFFFKRSLQFWIVWILQKEKQRRWSSTWEVAGKEGELSENGVQPSEQLYRICPCSSGPVAKWAMQFAFVP